MNILHSIAMVIAVGLAIHVYAAVCMGIVGLLVKFSDPEKWKHDKLLTLLMTPVILGVFIFVFATWPGIEDIKEEIEPSPEARARYRVWRRRLTALVSD